MRNGVRMNALFEQLSQFWSQHPVLAPVLWLANFVGVLVYGLAPLLIWRFLRIEIHPIRAVPLASLPSEALRAVGEAHPWLRKHGFEFKYCVQVFGGMVQNTPILLWNAAYEDRQHGRGAGVVVPSSIRRPGPSVFLLCTTYNDGSSVQTQLDVNPTVFPKPARFHELHVTGFDRDELLRLHIARENRRPEPVGTFMRSEVRCLASLSQGAAEETLTHRHSFEEMVSLGAMRRAGDSAYLISLPRAFVATWRLLFPMKQIVRWRTNRRARALLQLAASDRAQVMPEVKAGLPKYYDSSALAAGLKADWSTHDPADERSFMKLLEHRLTVAALDAAFSSGRPSDAAIEYVRQQCNFEGWEDDRFFAFESAGVHFTEMLRAYLARMGVSRGGLFPGSLAITAEQMTDFGELPHQLPETTFLLLITNEHECIVVCTRQGVDSPVFAYSPKDRAPRELAPSLRAFLEAQVRQIEAAAVANRPANPVGALPPPLAAPPHPAFPRSQHAAQSASPALRP